jgi:hypothetical protein
MALYVLGREPRGRREDTLHLRMLTRSKRAGQISGEFELQARGSLAADLNDEHQWVTVRGSFVAEGGSTIAHRVWRRPFILRRRGRGDALGSSTS